VKPSNSEPDRTLRATQRKLVSLRGIMLPLFARLSPVVFMDTTTREALFQDIVAGRTPNPERLAALARLLGITVQAALLDLLVEARGLA